MAFFWNKKKTKEESDKEKESLDSGLGKTKRSFFEKIQRAIAGKTTIDDDVLDGIEEALVASDIGVDTTLKIIDLLEDRVARDKYMNTSELHRILKEEMVKLLDIKDDDNRDIPVFDFSHKPYVILVVGVNGVGKTTTIGKLAANLCSRQECYARCCRHIQGSRGRSVGNLERKGRGTYCQTGNGCRSRFCSF